MEKKTLKEFKEIIHYVEGQNKIYFYLIWQEDHYEINMLSKTDSGSGHEKIKGLNISSDTAEYLIENIRSLDNSFKVQDLVKEMEEL